MTNNERYHFEKMLRDLRFPAYAIRRLDEINQHPNQDFKLMCKTVGIAFPIDMAEVHLTVHFKSLPDNRGVIADNYNAAIYHRPSDTVRDHTVKFDHPSTMNVDQAFALLDGRAVHQYRPGIGSMRSIWQQFDFKTPLKNGGYKLNLYADYNIEEAFARLPFSSSLHDHQRKDLFELMRAGELAPVTLSDDRQIYLFANPANKNILSLTADGKILSDKDLKPKISFYRSIQQRFKRKRGKGI
jgi:hypothetical protein